VTPDSRTRESSPPHDAIRIAVTLGDPRGIGPEVTESAVRRLRATGSAPHLILIGPSRSPQAEIATDYIDVGEYDAAVPRSAGRVAGRAIERAVALAKAGQVDAIVTAPIDKSAFHAAGYPYPGHTEMLAELSGGERVAMMMCAEETRLGGALRVVLATTHMPLSAVPAALTTDLLIEQAELTRHALTADWSIAQPRLALCALNPHASDSGLFGDEEDRVMRPAVDALKSKGVNIRGPIPADTVFVRALAGEFDAVIAPYHDVGMAAFKTAAFGRGVNVTLGLPFPRTSPDHGTALDIAGRGIADSSSMLEALELAIRLAHSRSRSIATMR
jgi:4-hydroxythreonine-4-phosphate dehydrogenase